MAFKVLLDANVLYPVYLRDLLLRFAYAGVFQARWSDDILDEMARNVKTKVPGINPASVDSTVSTMKEAFPEANVTGYERLIESVDNHEGDRHVLAAAIEDNVDVIVTSNLGHFPNSSCDPHDIDVQPPDAFLCYQWELRSPDYLLQILEDWCAELTNPLYSLEQLLEQRLSKRVPEFSEIVLSYMRR